MALGRRSLLLLFCCRIIQSTHVLPLTVYKEVSARRSLPNRKVENPNTNLLASSTLELDTRKPHSYLPPPPTSWTFRSTQPAYSPNPTASAIQHATLHLLPPNPTPLNHHSRPPSPHRYSSLPSCSPCLGSLLTTLDTETLALRTDADAMVANSWIAGVDGNAAATET